MRSATGRSGKSKWKPIAPILKYWHVRVTTRQTGSASFRSLHFQTREKDLIFSAAGRIHGRRNGVVALPRAHDETFANCLNVNLAIAPIGRGICRRVGYEILAAQFRSNIGKRFGQIISAVGEKSAAS